MSARRIAITIEGDFIDTFIYSGTLFAVDADSTVITYHWENLIRSVLKRRIDAELVDPVFEFLKDCRHSPAAFLADIELEIHLDGAELESHKAGIMRLDGWPIDINVYGNRFYAADEHGVLEVPFKWQEKAMDVRGRRKIWGHYAYRVAPNNANRLAIAAGRNGVYAVAPGRDFQAKRDLVSILEVETNDCEWIGQTLVANSEGGAYAAVFAPLPDYPKATDDSGALKAYAAARRSPPQFSTQLHSGENNVIYAWLGESKIFELLADGRLLVNRIQADSTPLGREDVTEITSEQLRVGAGHSLTSIIAARAAKFGSIVELGTSLLCYSEQGAELICERPVSWRVFPRAKNYVNHLHVVTNNSVSIFAYLPRAKHQSADAFGIAVEEVEEG